MKIDEDIMNNQLEAEHRIENANESGATLLHLSNLGLTTLPETIGKLTQLTTLYLDGNQLTTLPDDIGELTQLTHLNLGNNKFTTLPKDIGKLTQLTHLQLFNNQLTTLPDEMGKLTQLTFLNLNRNQLITLPVTLEKLKNISTCYIANNEQIPTPLDRDQLSAAVRYLKYNKGDIEWIPWGGLSNVFLEKKTVLALVETVFAVSVASILLTTLNRPVYWLLWASMSWLLLLRTEKTISTGLHWYGYIVKYLNIKNREHNEIHSKTLPLRLLFVGLLSLPTKILATSYATFCPLTNIKTALLAIPSNLRNHTLTIDLTTPPELMPGSEVQYSEGRNDIIIKNDLNCDIGEGNTLSLVRDKKRFNSLPLTQKLNRIILGLFFITAWCYRWSLKSTAIVYWPLYLIDSSHALTNAKDVMKNYANDKLSNLWIIIFMILSSYTLAYFPKFEPIKEAVEQSTYYPTSIVEVILKYLNRSLYTQNYEPWLGNLTLQITVLVFTCMLGLKWLLSDRLSKKPEEYQGTWFIAFKATLYASFIGASLLTWYGWEFIFRSLIHLW